MSANQLIDLLEAQGLLDPEVIVELRRNVAQSKSRITAESLARLLVDNGQLTRFQATRLIEQIQKASAKETNSPRGFSNPISPPVKRPPIGGDELDLLPDDLAPPGSKVDPNQPREAKLIPVEVVETTKKIEAEVVEPVEPTAIAESVKKKKRKTKSSPVEPVAIPKLDDDLASESSFIKPVKIGGPERHAWDSFRIWGVGFVLSVLLALFSGLVYWVVSGSSAQYYQQAKDAYETNDYELAIKHFDSFVKKFPQEEKASAAKAFSAIASIRQANDNLGDPEQAIATAVQILPPIVNEPSMNDSGIRSDLASALVSVAEKILQRADHAKSTQERKGLVEKLDRHLVLIRNPQYIPNANRLTNEGRIKSIEEDRARIVRDVQREEDLAVATEKMKEAVANSDVEAAYQARRSVTRKYPQLELDTELLELLQQATVLQQKAVKKAEVRPVLVERKETPTLGRSVLLFKRSGSEANVDSEVTLFVKAKGSIYALRGRDGQVLWRRYVGMESVSEPYRLSNDPGSDCLIVVPQGNRIIRLAAQDGSIVWQLDLGSRILQPSIEGETVYVATEDGRTHALDATTGQTKWSQQLPQSLEVGVGGGSDKSSRFLVGNHSNLYVLSRNDGTCTEVYYLGHAAGTISIPPLHALGQIIVFQNASVGNCLVRLFKINDKTGKLEVSKTSIPPLKGHVVVPPSLDGRRLVVMTDLGETIALDVEPASSGDKLNKIAGIVANETQPRVAWPLVVGNELWITSNRFSRFQIQVSKQTLVRDWVLEDEDHFTARPFKMDGYVVHTRVVRGTQGVRVTATIAETGAPVWEVDLGIPVVAIQGTSSGGIAAINSQAALFAIDSRALESKKPLNAVENPGRNQRLMRFSNPNFLPSGRLAMLNTDQGTHVSIYDPNASAGSNLQVNRLQITSGLPTAEPVAVGPALVIPLDNAQLIPIDPISGRSLGPPFQPKLTVGVDTQWLTPVVLSDQQTIVAATNQKTLYRLSSGKQIKELSQSNTSSAWVQRLAVVGDTVCGVSRGDAHDFIEFYKGTDLTSIDSVEVDGRVTWGPYAVGQSFLTYSETSGFMAFDSTGKKSWTTSQPQIAPIGPAVLQDKDFLINSTVGNMLRLSGETGELRATIKIGEPLSGPPVIHGNGMIFPGSEGVVIAIPTSQTMTSTPEVASP